MSHASLRMSEAFIESKVCHYAKNKGWRNRKMEFIGRRGCPDRWFQRSNGQLVIVEFKDANGKLSPHQRREINWLKDHGFDVYVIDNVEAGYALFDSYDAQGPEGDEDEDA